MWAANGTTTVHAYAMYDPDKNGVYDTEGGGTIRAYGTTADRWSTGSYVEGTTNSAETYSFATGTGYSGTIFKQSYKLKTSVITTQSGFYFAGWYKDKQLTTQETGNKDWEKTYKHNQNGGEITLYAIFKPVTVSGPGAVTNINVTNLYATATGAVTFNVANADEPTDFLASSSSPDFSIQNTSISGNVVTVTVSYTDKNHHGTNIASSYITLTSRGDAESKATATIMASSDLTPTFTKPVDYDFGTIYAGDAEGSEENLYATDLNTSANQAAPVSVGATGAKWTAEITGPGKAAFQLLSANPDKGQCVVNFVPTIAGEYEAYLELKVDYTDAYGHTISSTSTTTTLTGKAETPIESAIEFSPASIDFGQQVTGYTGSQKITVSQQNVSGITYSFGDTNTDNVFSFTSATGTVTITANPTAPGTYNATLTATGNDTRAGHEGETTIGTLSVFISVGLQSPVLVGGSNLKDTYYLKWSIVPCATSYEIYEVNNGVQTLVTGIDVANDGTYITRSVASTAAEKNYIVKAIGTNQNTTFEAWSNQITLQLNTIAVGGTPYLDIYTGTDLFVENTTYGKFPYYKKRQVDLSSTFDENGNALFDQLYVFGMTTNNDAATVTESGSGQTGPEITNPTSGETASNAVTPCYIYNKNANGNGYVLNKTIENMNLVSTTSPIPDVTANGQKLYYTGWCPFACNGNKNEKGVMYFTGGTGAKVDIYMEDLHLYARNHTESGAPNAPKIEGADTIKMELAFWDTKFITGSGSAFVFHSTSTNTGSPFAPNIHLRGTNKLLGGNAAVHATLLTEEARAGIYSSPIHLFVENENQATTLSIDDKWLLDKTGATECTNGSIDLCASDGRPCVELGNDRSTLNFNGGQIYLKNSAPTSASYLCTFAIGRRKFKKEVSVVNAALSGMGNDTGDGSVNFNDGSIYCRELSEAQMKKWGAYYRSSNSMKCPKNTKINGGTHYCDIWACSAPENLGASPTNKYDNPLVTARFHINNIPAEPYYLATVNFDSIANALVCQDNAHADYSRTLAQYYSGKDTYGRSSMKADETDSVTLMLPYQFTGKEFVQEEITLNWVVCMPTLSAGAAGYEQTFGGPKTVITGETEHTRFLAYGEIDKYVRDVLASGSYISPKADKSGGLSEVQITTVDNNEFRNDILNTAQYQIDEAQYLIRPINAADEWVLFSPPFDVTNVWVVEAYKEDLLEPMFNDYMLGAEGAQDPYEKQAYAMIDIFFYMGYFGEYEKSNANLWTIIDQEWKRNVNITNKGRGQVKLTHFTGSNYATANYYLQRSSGKWQWDGSKFTTDWSYLPAAAEKVTHGDTEYNVIMKKGSIYSMMFPYAYPGYDGWDYWTGKYLVFEGLGPQAIEGKEYHEEIRRAMETASGTAEIRANNTLAELVVDNAEAYYAFGNAQKFTRSLSQGEDNSLLPGEGFILANAPAPAGMPQRIKSIDLMSGDVTLEGGDGTATGTPTIAGNNKMLVYSINGGVGIVPVVAQQVRIYNAAGQVVTTQYLTSETQIPLPTGIYLVTGEKEQCKVMVK